MVDDEQEGVERVREWIGRLEGFVSTLSDIDAYDPMNFCAGACDAWIDTAFRNPPPPATPAMLIILETLEALADVTTTVVMDYYNTPDVRDRMTRDAAQQSLSKALDDVLRDSQAWLDHGLFPSAGEIELRSNAARAGLRAAQEAAEKIKAEEEAREAEVAADSYGATCRDPGCADVATNFANICLFTADENKRYRDAYARLREMIDSGSPIDMNYILTWSCAPSVTYKAGRCC